MFTAGDGEKATTMLCVNGGATVATQGSGSDVMVTCKRRRRASSLDCLSLIVDSLATSVAAERHGSVAVNSAYDSTTTTTSIA